MRILFVSTNTYRFLNPQPLGANLVASRLKADGHQVRFVDLMFERDPVGAATAAAKEHRPQLACFSIRNRDNQSPDDYFDPLPEVARVVAAVKATAPMSTLLGGTAFTTFPERILAATGADYGLAGDDLEPISRLVRSLEAGTPDLETPGLVYRAQSGAIAQNPFALVGYLKVHFDLPGFIDLHRYRRGYWQGAVVTRSGCPERCAFCDTFHTFGRRFILREPRAVAEELLALKRTGKVRSAFLVDGGFNRPLAHAKEILREVLRLGAQLQLYSVFDPGECDEEFLNLYRRAGGAMVVMFAESLADPVLRALDKPFDAATVERDAAALRRAGLGFIFQPTFGSPGETPATVEETLARMEGLGAALTELSIGWRIQPRTPLRERAVAEGLLAADDDCYLPRFYVSPQTPRPWLEARLARARRRHRFDGLRAVPLFTRLALERPWRRGPEAVGPSR